jgi:hypothetical protein
MHDYDIQRCSRRCQATGRELAEGEDCFSVLVTDGAQLVRQDYAREAWSGPPDRTLAWWRFRVPTRDASRPRLAPSDVLLSLLEQLEHEPDREELRYVLALWLVRRRVLRIEQNDGQMLELYCPRQERTYRLRASLPGPDRADEVERQLADLLASGA